ncbi:hypothetical protein BS50DRAFT_569333 [Corynespora cassiicola Philippines]|uniref:Uncharacterized protein n=1 Tax=Corynespora cassiicola Philippines TaxID=1448308 RepID=A0A2T2P2E7_CORCC|nr:hypothetical protein BS50DRAFT_569333 [Corynespora cassiicola Philippines]
MVYSRDVVVDCVNRHYELLVQMVYLNPADVEQPPCESWSDDQLAIDILLRFRFLTSISTVARPYSMESRSNKMAYSTR